MLHHHFYLLHRRQKCSLLTAMAFAYLVVATRNHTTKFRTNLSKDSTFGIYYLQSSTVTYTSNSASGAQMISDLDPTFVTSEKYGFTYWMKINAWMTDGGWTYNGRVSNNYA